MSAGRPPVDDLAPGLFVTDGRLPELGPESFPSARDENDDGEDHGDEKNAAEDEPPADIGAGAAGSGGVRRRMRSYAVRGSADSAGACRSSQQFAQSEYFWPQRRQVVSGMKPIR